MPFVPWVPTTGNAPTPLPVSLGGTGGTSQGTAFASLGVYEPWIPADDGFLGANADVAGSSGGGLAIAGTLVLTKLVVRSATTITNLFFCTSAVGVGASTGSFVGLYSAAGSLLSGSADVGATAWVTAGWNKIPLTSPQAVAAGTVVFAAALCNLATTQVTLVRAFNSVNASPQATVTAATQRWGQFAAVGTSLPASLTMSSMAATSNTFQALWS